MGRLTTHVLDTAQGVPAKGIGIDLFKIYGDNKEKICTLVTNEDGRCQQPLLENEQFTKGEYELVFAAGDYFRQHDYALDDPAFLDHIVIRFSIAKPQQHYHVPLLVSPYGYSTYRGS